MGWRQGSHWRVSALSKEGAWTRPAQCWRAPGGMRVGAGLRRVETWPVAGPSSEGGCAFEKGVNLCISSPTVSSLAEREPPRLSPAGWRSGRALPQAGRGLPAGPWLRPAPAGQESLVFAKTEPELSGPVLPAPGRPGLSPAACPGTGHSSGVGGWGWETWRLGLARGKRPPETAPSLRGARGSLPGQRVQDQCPELPGLPVQACTPLAGGP